MSLTDQEVEHRARGLSALGNSPARVRATLAASGASAGQIENAMRPIEAGLRDRRQADARYLQWLVAASAMFMLAIVAGVVMLNAGSDGPVTRPDGAGPQPSPLPGQRATQALPLLPGLPADWVAPPLPTGLATDFMAATPVVRRGSGPASTGCPSTSIEAAALFGGEAGNWTFDASVNGWSMMTIGSGVTVQVPENMVAGYLIITDAPQMLSVDGPSTLTNVNFVAISCP